MTTIQGASHRESAGHMDRLAQSEGWAGAEAFLRCDFCRPVGLCHPPVTHRACGLGCILCAASRLSALLRFRFL